MVWQSAEWCGKAWEALWVDAEPNGMNLEWYESGMMKSEKKFCVNVLSDQQEDVANEFFRKENDPWEVISWYESAEGLPAIEGSLASIDCSVFNVVEAGDHWFVIGEVLGAEIMETGSPLLFLGGSYGQYRGN